MNQLPFAFFTEKRFASVKEHLTTIAQEAGLDYEMVREMPLLEFMAVYREVKRAREEKAAARAQHERALEAFRNAETIPAPPPVEES